MTDIHKIAADMAEALRPFVAARKAHIDAVDAYNRKRKIALAERENGDWSTHLDVEYKEMGLRQSEFIGTAQALYGPASAALAAYEAHKGVAKPTHSDTLRVGLQSVSDALSKRPAELRGPFPIAYDDIAEFKPCVIHYEEGDFSQMLLEDCPIYVGTPVTVQPIHRVSDKTIVGFQWDGVSPLPTKPADDWIPWNGGECPVGGAVRVAVRLADDQTAMTGAACIWDWGRGDHITPIIAYRVLP